MSRISSNKTGDLPAQLKETKKVIFTSTDLNLTKSVATDNTTLSVINDHGDTVLAVIFCRSADSIILDTKKVGHTTMDGFNKMTFVGLERAFGPPSSSDSTVVIQDDGKTYKVTINGNYLSTFDKIPEYKGSVVSKASYVIDNLNNDLMFQDPIDVEVIAGERNFHLVYIPFSDFLGSQCRLTSRKPGRR